MHYINLLILKLTVNCLVSKIAILRLNSHTEFCQKRNLYQRFQTEHEASIQNTRSAMTMYSSSDFYRSLTNRNNNRIATIAIIKHIQKGQTTVTDHYSSITNHYSLARMNSFKTDPKHSRQIQTDVHKSTVY